VCLTASAVIIALSIADRHGMKAEKRLSCAQHRAVWIGAFAAIAVVTGGICFQKVDDWRVKRLKKAKREEDRLDCGSTRARIEKQTFFLEKSIHRNWRVRWRMG
jgi:hypothetical protein